MMLFWNSHVLLLIQTLSAACLDLLAGRRTCQISNYERRRAENVRHFNTPCQYTNWNRLSAAYWSFKRINTTKQSLQIRSFLLKTEPIWYNISIASALFPIRERADHGQKSKRQRMRQGTRRKKSFAIISVARSRIGSQAAGGQYKVLRRYRRKWN